MLLRAPLTFLPVESWNVLHFLPGIKILMNPSDSILLILQIENDNQTPNQIRNHNFHKLLLDMLNPVDCSGVCWAQISIRLYRVLSFLFLCSDFLFYYMHILVQSRSAKSRILVFNSVTVVCCYVFLSKEIELPLCYVERHSTSRNFDFYFVSLYFLEKNVHVLYQIQENTANNWKWSWQVSCQSYGQWPSFHYGQ